MSPAIAKCSLGMKGPTIENHWCRPQPLCAILFATNLAHALKVYKSSIFQQEEISKEMNLQCKCTSSKDPAASYKLRSKCLWQLKCAFASLLWRKVKNICFFHKPEPNPSLWKEAVLGYLPSHRWHFKILATAAEAFPRKQSQNLGNFWNFWTLVKPRNS